MSTYNDSLWEIASADHQAEHETGLLSAASVEAAPVLAFLVEAESTEDFGNRLALMEARIHAVASAVAGQGTPDYTTIVTTLPHQFFEQWQVAFAARQDEAQRRNARRAFERRQARARRVTAKWQEGSPGTFYCAYTPGADIFEGTYAYTSPRPLGKYVWTVVVDGREVASGVEDTATAATEAADRIVAQGHKTAAGQQQFDADLAKYQDALEGGGWVESGTDPDGTPFFYIKPGAPPDLVSGYQRLMEYGYANGLVASRRIAGWGNSGTCGNCEHEQDEHGSGECEECADEVAQGKRSRGDACMGYEAAPKEARKTAADSPPADLAAAARDNWGGSAAESTGASAQGFVSGDGYAYRWVNMGGDWQLATSDGAYIKFRKAGDGWEYEDYDGWKALPKALTAEERQADFDEWKRRGDEAFANELQRIKDSGDEDAYHRFMWGSKRTAAETQKVTVYLVQPPEGLESSKDLNQAINDESHPRHEEAYYYYTHSWGMGGGYDPNLRYVEAISYDAPAGMDDQEICDKAFQEFNIGTGPLAQEYRAGRNRSLSTGDVVVVGGRAWHCDSFGWSRITNFKSSKVAGHRDPGFCKVCGQAIRPAPTKGYFSHYDSLLELAHQAVPNEATVAWYSENAPEYLIVDASRTAANIPTGRSDYRPGQGRVGEPSPQTDPDLFSSEDILAEIKYLMRANERYGEHPLRTTTYLGLMRVLRDRGFTARTAADESNAWPPKEGGEATAGDPQAPPAAPSATQEPGQQPAQNAGGTAGAIQQGDILLDAADGQPHSYEVTRVQDQGDSVLVDVTKDGAEQMQLQIPKTEQVNVLPTTGGTPDAPISEPQQVAPGTEGDPADPAAPTDPAAGGEEAPFNPFAQGGDSGGSEDPEGGESEDKPEGDSTSEGEESQPSEEGESEEKPEKKPAEEGEKDEEKDEEKKPPFGKSSRRRQATIDLGNGLVAILPKTAEWSDETKQRASEEYDKAPKCKNCGHIEVNHPPRGDAPGACSDFRTASRRTAMPNPVDLGVKVGDIFECSWGYDQTNIDFYEVVRLTPQSVVVRQVRKTRVSSEGQGHRFVPDKGNYVGEPMTRRIQTGWRGSPYISINSFSGASLWDGTPSWETDSMFGH